MCEYCWRLLDLIQFKMAENNKNLDLTEKRSTELIKRGFLGRARKATKNLVYPIRAK